MPVADDGAFVPALWRFEVGNSLTIAIRRNRIDAEFRRAAFADLALLDITTDQHTDALGATLDGSLSSAAATFGVRLLGGE